jgi:glutamate carboxypeptidase
VYELARILNAFRETLAGEAHLTFNPGVVLGGTSVEFDPVQVRGSRRRQSNVVAENAVAQAILRALSREQFDRQKNHAEIVAASLPQTSATITFDEGYPPMAPTEGNAKLLRCTTGEPRSRIRSGDGGQPRPCGARGRVVRRRRG